MSTHYRYEARSWQAALPAVVLTIAIFAGLPLVDTFRSKQDDHRKLYELTRVILPPPPPPPPRMRRKETVHENVPKPTLVEPRRLIPLEAVLSLDMALGEIAGDFDLDFRVATPDLLDAGNYIFEIDQVDQDPQPIARIEPSYPPRARMRNIEGEVLLEFVVDSDGSVRDAVVKASTPEGIFEDSALRAVRRWKFKPAMKGGEAVPVRVIQNVIFTFDR